MVSYAVDQIFNGQSLSSYAQAAKDKVKEEVTDQLSRGRTPITSRYRDRGEVIAAHAIAVPQITSKEARVRGEIIEYLISFDGANGTFFRFSPSDRPTVEQPRGQVFANGVIMKVPNSQNAAEIKAELTRKFEAFSEWFHALVAEAEEFNRCLPAEIDRIVRECEEAHQAARDLEAELNG